MLRALCPFHGSDHQRSLRVKVVTGQFRCFACGAWGYLAEARARRQEEQRAPGRRTPPPARRTDPAISYAPPRGSSMPRGPRGDPIPVRDDLVSLLRTYQEALPGSAAEAYLCQRKVPLGLARQYGVGYAAPGQWAHGGRDWRWGRVVFPHTTPDGQIVNLYGRAIGSDGEVPKHQRHDHLPGAKGYFNAVALRIAEGPLFVCEGAFDALSLIAAGYPPTVAIFGVDGWRWKWARDIRRFIFALDADTAGQQAWRMLARGARLRGKDVAYLPGEAYGGHKDVNRAWVAGVLVVGTWAGAPVVHGEARDASISAESRAAPPWWREVASWPDGRREAWEERSSIMEIDGGLSRDAAEQEAYTLLAERPK